MSINYYHYNRRFMPSIEAFGERKPMFDWTRDPRCVVRYGTLANRINSGWTPEDALTTPVDRKERHYRKPQTIIEAFGERKTAIQWKDDSRATVSLHVFTRRIQHGWSTESALTTPLSTSRGRKEQKSPVFEFDGDSKSLREWALDDRCKVSEMTLRKNVQQGMPLGEALQFRRRPGRNLGMPKEDIGRELEDLTVVVSLMSNGGELWIYETPETRRMSIIHNDVRHILAEETFDKMQERKLIQKVFETDTIKNFELTGAGRALIES